MGIAQSYEILDALSDALLLVHEAETGQGSYIRPAIPLSSSTTSLRFPPALKS